MAETARPLIRDVSPETIERLFRKGEITQKDRYELMVMKAHDENFRLLEEKGFPVAVFKQAVKNFEEVWKMISEDARDADRSAWKSMLISGWAAWKGITAITDALGEVTGHQVETLMLNSGASAGAARFANYASDVGANLIKYSALTRSLTRTVQHVARTMAGPEAAIKAGATAAGAAGAAGEATAQAAEEAVMKKVEQAVVKGLASEGKQPPLFVGNEMADVTQVPALRTPTPKSLGGGKFELPRELAGASINFNIGENVYHLRFKEDLDKALVILAQDKPSRRDADYLKLVMNHLGMSEPEVRLLARDVKSGVKGDLVGMPFGVHDIRSFAKEYLSGARLRPSQNVHDPGYVGTRIAEDIEKVKKRAPKADRPAKIANANLEQLQMDRNWTNLQLNAYVTALQPHVDELGDLAKKALAGGDQELQEFARFATHLFIADPTGIKKPVITVEFRNLLTHWDPDSMAKNDLPGAMRTLAADMASLSSAKLLAFTITAQSLYASYGAPESEGGSTAQAGAGVAWRMAREVYANMLLPFSWAPTFVGNVTSTSIHVAERALGAAFSTSKQGLVNKEAFYFQKGMMLATGDAMRAFKESYQYTVVKNAAGEYEAVSTAAGHAGQPVSTLGRFDQTSTIPGPLGRLVRVPGDTVRGMDNVFNAMLYRGALYARYIREADQQGLKGQAAGNYVLGQMNGPPSRAAYEEAHKIATDNTFQSQLGRVGRGIEQVSGWGPAFLYFPFVRSAINTAKFTWARTPGLQLVSKQLYKDLAAGGAVADMAQGRLILSNLMASFVWDMARDGYITGEGPQDATLRKAWMATHQPNSVRTPGGWMPMNNTEPASTNMRLIADIAEVAPYMSTYDFEQASQAILFSVLKSFGDSTWFHNGADLVDAVQHFETQQPLSARNTKVVFNPLLTVSTGGPLMNRLRQADDPVYRDARTLTDMWRNSVLGFSKTLPPIRDGYGDVVVPPQPLGGNWFGLLKPAVPSFKPFETDPIKKEGDRLQARLPTFNRNLGGSPMPEGTIRPVFPEEHTGINLNPQQLDQRIRIYGELVKDPQVGLGTLMQKDVYNVDAKTGRPVPQPLQRQLFTGHARELWEGAGQRLLKESPTLQKQLQRRQELSVQPLMVEPAPAGQEVPVPEVAEPTPEEQANLLRYD